MYMIKDDTFPDSIHDPRENVPNLDPTLDSTDAEDIQPNDPSDSLPSVSESFEMAPKKSAHFISTVAYVKSGVLLMLTAVLLFFFTDYSIRYVGTIVVMALYCFSRAKDNYDKLG